MMESLFEPSFMNDEDFLLHMKKKLLSGTESSQIWVVEQISKCLKETYESERGAIVKKLVKLDMISTICHVMQTADKDFVKVVLECFELVSVHKEFYENHNSVHVIRSMIRLSYCKNKSRKASKEFVDLVQSICNVLIRSEKCGVNLDNVCVPQQIIVFCKDLDIQNLQGYTLKFNVVKIVNIIMQQLSTDDNDIDIKMCIDVCHDALKSMAEIVKCSDDDSKILLACSLLCGTYVGSSRLCTIDFKQEDQKDINLCKRCADLFTCVYDTMMHTIIPYIKEADLSHVDSKIEFYRNFVFCLNELYQQGSYNHDDLSSHLTANGYLKYFLYLRYTIQLPENLRRSICLLLSRILSILGRKAFSMDTFATTLHHGFLELPKDSVMCNEVIAHDGKAGMALMILMYYHYHGTLENLVSLESLIARIMLLSQITPSLWNPNVLKPLWFLFAVTSLSHPHPNLVYHYEDTVNRLTYVLQYSELSNVYTHHIDLIHYCLKCPNFTQDLMKQILNLWLIESDGDIKPLLSFNCDKVVEHLLIVIQLNHPERCVSLAVKGLRQIIQLNKDNEHVGRIAKVVWYILPNILSLYQTKAGETGTSCHTAYISSAKIQENFLLYNVDCYYHASHMYEITLRKSKACDIYDHFCKIGLGAVASIKAVLELVNIVQPPTMPKYLITRITDIIVYIILQQNTDLNFVTLVVTQAHVVLITAMANKANKVLPKYIQKQQLLKILYAYGFSKERSQLSMNSLILLGYIIQCQKHLSIKCRNPLKIKIKDLVELLKHARKSLFTSKIETQLVCELLTQNVDGSAVVLQDIATDTSVDDWLVNLYGILINNIVIQKHLEVEIYKCLVALLHFCNAKASAILVPYMCTILINYDLIFYVINLSDVSPHFAEFVTVWLDYRKKTCNDVPWNPRSLFRTSFDDSLDYLKLYCIRLQNKELNDASLALQRALLQFE